MSAEQISIFQLMGDDGTPEIMPEDQKKGRRGWIIEISAILLKKNEWKEDAVCVCTRPIIFESDTKIDQYRRISQHWKATYGPAEGGIGGNMTVYAKRPRWDECMEYARKRYTIPETVLYYERNGDFHAVWGYENGYGKEAKR